MPPRKRWGSCNTSASPLPLTEKFYAGAVPRLAAFLRNGVLDFPGFRRALIRACELAQGHLALAPEVARATGAWDPLGAFAEEVTRARLLEVISGSLELLAREAAELAAVYPNAAKDIRAARQLAITHLEAIQADLRALEPPSSPVAELLRAYALAHARWLSSRGVPGGEKAAADAQQQLAAARAEIQLAELALAAAIAAVRSHGGVDPVLRAEQDAWVASLSAAVPRSLV